jgi:hypothetical protein
MFGRFVVDQQHITFILCYKHNTVSFKVPYEKKTLEFTQRTPHLQAENGLETMQGQRQIPQS